MMVRHVVSVFPFLGVCLAITNNADLIWYEKDAGGQAQNYFARQPIPEGLIRAQKIVVNQQLPLLWEVKFAFFDNLESLAIDGCGVNEIRPRTFKDLKPLTNLSLTHNNIKEIKEGVFNSVQIKNLNFSHNRISIIAPHAFDDMPVLDTIILDFNELKTWNSDWFFNCTNIRTVSITHNFLETLPEKAFKNFWVQPETEVDVYFGYNKINTIGVDAFKETGHFGDLFLDSNELEEIDVAALEKLTAVEDLNLNGNSLHCLPNEGVDKFLSKIKRLSVKNNPIKCTCLKDLQKNYAEKIKLPPKSDDC